MKWIKFEEIFESVKRTKFYSKITSAIEDVNLTYPLSYTTNVAGYVKRTTVVEIWAIWSTYHHVNCTLYK